MNFQNRQNLSTSEKNQTKHFVYCLWKQGTDWEKSPGNFQSDGNFILKLFITIL